MMGKCLICGKELPMDMTQIVITEGVNKYSSVCCSHEGSEELNNLIGKRAKDLCKEALANMAMALDEVEMSLGRKEMLNVLATLVEDNDLRTASNLIRKDCEPSLDKSQLAENQYSEGNEEAGYIGLKTALGFVEEVLNCDDRNYGDVEFQYFVRPETDEEAEENEHDDSCTWFIKDECANIEDLRVQYEMS
jgi:hypothetical protein